MTSVFSLPRLMFKAMPAVVAISFAGSGFAQEAVPSDLAPSTNPGLSQQEIEALQGPSTPPAPTVSGEQLTETPRRLNYGVSLTVRGVYDDNILLNSVNETDDFYFAIEPSIFIGFGGQEDAAGASSLRFIYRPSIFLFLDQSEHDTVQHLIRLTGNHTFGRLTVSLSQDIQILDGADLNSLSDPTGHNANIDVGQRTRHNIYTTTLSDSYVLTGKLFLSNAIGLIIDQYPSNFIGSNNIFGNLFLNYTYSDKLTVGLGGTFGYNTVEQGSPDQTYEQANIRLNYAATGKISLSTSAGVEFRQFDDSSFGSGVGTEINPVFDLSGTYKPFDGTSMSLVGSRRIQNSASQLGQDYTTTNFHFNITQRFLRRFNL
ncbi:MAG TPA: hypothetical protein VJ719_08830, partial [Chthoniobacterales bacterium]|nr:hypothetical protein [Chthoniobacterales bacterium]